ncbi:MAG: hypothetical protein KF703_06525 [Actinobacteria bacterium]|nr:hypothetical protein [Actinomycetota bacterium]
MHVVGVLLIVVGCVVLAGGGAAWIGAERAGTFRLLVDARVPVSGRLEIRTVRTPADRSDRAREIVVLGVLVLGGGIVILRLEEPGRRGVR